MGERLVYISMGSNLGDRESNLAQATMALSVNLEISKIKSSSYYNTEPMYIIDQPDFLNSVVKLSTKLPPFEFLDTIKKVEKMLGSSPKRKKNRPRIIDIDILFHGDSVIETDSLIIPHPMIALRKFVLIPFAEIEPDFKIPHSNLTINDLIEHCPDKSRVEKHFMNTQA